MLDTHIPTLLGIMFIVVSIVTSILYIEQIQQTKIQAALDGQPQNIRVTNISDTSITVTWLSQDPSKSILKWGESPLRLSNYYKEADMSNTHSITLVNLDPKQDYYFTIITNDTEFDNNGIPWTAKTGPALPLAKKSKTISGTVQNVLGQPMKGVLVYLTLGGATTYSSLTTMDGSFIFSLSKIRTLDLNSYILNTSNTSIPVEIVVYSNTRDGFIYRHTLDTNQESLPLLIQQGTGSVTQITEAKLPEAELKVSQEELLPGFGDFLDSALLD